eukprot:scaffold7767_cov149-Amphora_coffeaeformis.AAC.1
MTINHLVYPRRCFILFQQSHKAQQIIGIQSNLAMGVQIIGRGFSIGMSNEDLSGGSGKVTQGGDQIRVSLLKDQDIGCHDHVKGGMWQTSVVPCAPPKHFADMNIRRRGRRGGRGIW